MNEHEEERTWIIVIRNVPNSLYMRLKNVKAKYGAKSWKQMLEQLTAEYEEEIKEVEWL